MHISPNLDWSHMLYIQYNLASYNLLQNAVTESATTVTYVSYPHRGSSTVLIVLGK